VCFRLLEEILRYIHAVARRVEDDADKPTAKFWRVLLNKAYEVLDKVGTPRTRVLSRCVTLLLHTTSLPLAR